MYVVNEVNGTAVIDKIVEAHHHNNEFHRGHSHHRHNRHHGHDDDVCITEEDVKSINFDDVHLDPISRDCIDTCAPIAQKAALAAGCAAATTICAIALLVCSLGAFLCALCCKGRESCHYEKVCSAHQGVCRCSSKPARCMRRRVHQFLVVSMNCWGNASEY